MKIKMELDDDTVYEATANPKTFNGLATKSAFKKQFGVPPIVLSLMGEVFVEDDEGKSDGDDDEDAKVHLDLSAIAPEHLQYIDEEYLAFLVWMELKRRCDDLPDDPWDKLVERIVDVVIDTSDDKAAEEGTGPTSAATST